MSETSEWQVSTQAAGSSSRQEAFLLHFTNGEVRGHAAARNMVGGWQALEMCHRHTACSCFIDNMAGVMRNNNTELCHVVCYDAKMIDSSRVIRRCLHR